MSDKLVPLFMPSLAALIVRVHKEVGRPLSRGEVYRILDKAAAMMAPWSTVDSVVKRRGYEDFNPDTCYEDYLAYMNEQKA